MTDVDLKDKPATAALPEAKIVHQPNLPPNGPQPLARPISYSPPGLALLRFSATTLTMVAMAQIYVGLAAYLFKGNADIIIHFVGAFWVGLYLIVPGILGMLSNTRAIVVAGLITGFIGILVSFTGVIVDGSAFAVYSTVKACGQSNATISANGVYSEIEYVGNSSSSSAAQYCAFFNPDFDCSCTNSVMLPQIGPHPECYLFDGGNSGELKSSCAPIMTDYPAMLEASFSVCIVCLSVVLVYTVFVALSLFCPTIFDRAYIPVPQEERKDIEAEQADMEKGMKFYGINPMGGYEDGVPKDDDTDDASRLAEPLASTSIFSRKLWGARGKVSV